MKKSIAVFLLVFITSALAAKPALPSQCEVWLPKVLDADVIQKNDAYKVAQSPYGQNLMPSHKSYWIVFSDRENNQTYEQPKGNAAKCTTLGFNERLIIASIKNGYALVYSEPKVSKYPYISDAAESKGWVPMSNLLLWNKGLADEADIMYKAVICANLNQSGNESEGQLYKSPSGKSVGQLKTDMHFYFVMKEEGNKVLLGYYASLKTDSDRGLYGWVDKNSFVPWNQRTCLEPTWDLSHAPWFIQNGVKWQVYPNANAMTGQAPAESVYSRNGKRSTGQYATEYEYRTMPGSRLRYPILEGCTDALYYCSSFGTLGATSTGPDIDEDIRAAIADIKNTEVINIGILIDGTASMKPYFASVKNAIIEGCRYFGENAQVNIAVAIYRDKEDGEYVLETFPSTGGFTSNPNNPKLQQWLETVGKYGAKSRDTDEKEALLYGMKGAIEKFGFNPRQSNLLLVVGDCGDNGKMGVKREEVIDLLAEKRISLMAFQVRNEQRDSYQTFNTQMTYIMKSSMQKRYIAQAKNAGNVITADFVKSVSMDTGWDIYNTNLNPDINLYRYVHRRMRDYGKNMDATQLTSLMVSTISEWNQRIEYLRDIAIDVVNGFANNNDGDGTLTPALIELFGGDVERFNRLLRSNALTSFRGWTYKKHPSSGRELYKIVVFLPDGELRTLIEKLQPVYNVARTRSNDRKPYINAMMTLAGTLTAQDKVKDMKYKEIIAKVFGLGAGTTVIDGPSLADIADPNVVSQEEYLSLVNKMKTSYEKLLRIMGEPYPFMYELAGSNDKYYWLPSEYLPL